MNNNKTAYILAGITVFFWSTVASAFKIGLEYFDYAALLLYSSLLSFIIYLIYTSITGKIKLALKSSKKEFLSSMLLGFFNPFFYYLLIFKSYELLPAQIAQPLNFTWPIVLVLLSSVFLSQKFGLKSFIGLLISFLGVVIISSKGSLSGYSGFSTEGMVYALSSSVFWALFWIFNVRDKRSTEVKLLLNFFFGFIFSIIYVSVFSSFNYPNLNGIFASVYIASFEMGFTFLIWLQALKLIDRTDKIANLIYLTPFISLFIINIVIGESILTSTIIGLLFIIGGILVQKKDPDLKK